jgi:hypothetical protein
VTSKPSFPIFTSKKAHLSPAQKAGLFVLLLMLSGCQAVTPPDQVTASFWEAMVQGNLESAGKHVTSETRNLVVKQQNLEDGSVDTGSVDVNGNDATVLTILTLKKPENKVLSFETVLLKENQQWKVDYQKTLDNLSLLPFGELFKSLKTIGDTINKELERQIPLFENQLRSFSEELLRQLEEFRRQLEKTTPPDSHRPGTI